MKQLFILRHAKTSPLLEGQDDRARPLNERGHQAARAMGRYLRPVMPGITNILCSSALRGEQTLQGLFDGAQMPADKRFAPPVSVEDGLYLCGAEKLMERLRRISGDNRRVLLIGHNPDLQELIQLLCHEAWFPEQLDSVRGKMPTGSLAIVNLPREPWFDLDTRHGVLAHYVTPVELAAGA